MDPARSPKRLPEARVVKVFNTVGNALMYKPELPGGPPSVVIAGNDDEAKGQTATLLRHFGWEAVDIGGIEGSRYVEVMCIALVLYGIKSGTACHAYKLLR